MPIPETDPLYAAFGRAIRFHYCRMQVLLQQLGAYPGQPPLLFVLGKHGPLSQKELAARLHLTPATVTVMLRRMERAGLVARRGDPADRRVSAVHLTARGRALRDRVKRSLHIIAAECFADFSPAQRRQLQALLGRLQDNLERACERIERGRMTGNG